MEQRCQTQTFQVFRITQPTPIQVLVTPTCPYCPGDVRMAHKLALENEHIVADMVEVVEFPRLSQKYGVQGVPKTARRTLSPSNCAACSKEQRMLCPY